ncbi:hypothetical protein [Rhizobium sp. S96]|uniref:hypothetical protein n=1 Tax=Rhizobium sp. S96 TaxID=3055140 RepID=UPI0025AA724B|nr:hypothetical protein [Rhizobium sp. S96]MDM9623155.1 hypothetical protein [Rhizobium sp. S96]
MRAFISFTQFISLRSVSPIETITMAITVRVPQLTNLTRTLVLPVDQPLVDERQQQIDALTARVKDLEAEVATLKNR